MADINNIDSSKLPKHVAVIMDGNGRWAKKQGQVRVFGHEHGVISVRETVEAAAEVGVKYLTLYAFSTENWNRPKGEVEALMQLLVSTIASETATLNKNSIRLNVIGNLDALPEFCREELRLAIEETKNNKHMTLTIALSYSSKWEITEAIKKIAAKVERGEIKASDINEVTVDEHLSTAGMPDPELLIRTSGEQRISNFLLWQLAYAEFYFTEKLWPDFRKQDFFEAIANYQSRERRFGQTSEQLIQT
jgi:undecaprenyl diphosphate synthase